MLFRRIFQPDRRRRRRQLLNTSVRALTESGWVDALGINVSEVGMSLFTVANLDVGSQVQVEFVLPDDSEPTRICGIVRHRALYLYGVEFMPESGRSSLAFTDTVTQSSHSPRNSDESHV